MQVTTYFRCLVLISLLVFRIPILSAQENTDGKFIFKTQLFLEHLNQHSREENYFPSKNYSLYTLFDSVIDLKIDTIKSREFTDNFIFLSVVPFKNNQLVNDSAIVYRATNLKNALTYVSIPVNQCEGYIICINKKSGRSFRLQGFYGNDLLHLIKEVKEEYKKKNKKDMSTKQFLKAYTVANLDFNCIYKELTSGIKKEGMGCHKFCRDFEIKIN